jgi:hypothetical protein
VTGAEGGGSNLDHAAIVPNTRRCATRAVDHQLASRASFGGSVTRAPCFAQHPDAPSTTDFDLPAAALRRNRPPQRGDELSIE